MSQIHAERTQTNVVLPLAVSRDGGLAGMTAVVAIRDGNSSTSYLDFSDNTFKSAAWVTRQAPLTDLGGGFYARLLNVAAITNLPGSTHVLVAEYTVTGNIGGVDIGGVDEDHILLVDTLFDISSDVWNEPLAGHTIAGTTGAALGDAAASSYRPNVMASFAFDQATNAIDGNVWLVVEGQLLTSVTSASAEFYGSDGTLLFPALTDLAPDAQGVFHVSKVNPDFSPGEQIYCRLAIVTPSGTYTSLKGLQVVG